MVQSLYKTDSRFQNHMRNLDNFRQVVESPKKWDPTGYICLKTTFLHLRHYLQIYLTLLSTYLWFGKWRGIWQFFSRASKIGILMGSSTEELSVMTMKNYAKFEEELTCHFKVHIRNLTNFDPSTWKSQKFSP